MRQARSVLEIIRIMYGLRPAWGAGGMKLRRDGRAPTANPTPGEDGCNKEVETSGWPITACWDGTVLQIVPYLSYSDKGGHLQQFGTRAIWRVFTVQPTDMPDCVWCRVVSEERGGVSERSIRDLLAALPKGRPAAIAVLGLAGDGLGIKRRLEGATTACTSVVYEAGASTSRPDGRLAAGATRGVGIIPEFPP